MDQVEFQCDVVKRDNVYFSILAVTDNLFFFFTHFCLGDERIKILYFEFIFCHNSADSIPTSNEHRSPNHLSVPNGFHFRSEMYRAVVEFDCFTIFD